jgi:hypothetical protein
VSSIWDANEAFYAQTPREMLDAHDYVTPSFNFQLRMNKPVLSYWEVAASYRLFQTRILESYEQLVGEYDLHVMDATKPIEYQQKLLRRAILPQLGGLRRDLRLHGAF